MDQARLRPAQVGASTAAAVGGAFLATRMGVYGTIIGVGVITLMSTVGSEMLLRSLERTKQAARLADPRQRGVAATARDAGAPTEVPELATTEQAPAGDPADTSDAATIELPGTATPTGSQTATTEQPATTALADPADEPGARPSKARRWPLVAGGFLASFGLALAVIAGIETFTGRSLHGDGGTTVVNVLRGAAGQGADDAPTGPATPTEEPTAPAQEDDGATGDDTSSQPDSRLPAESPAPSDEDGTQQRDEEAATPDDEETPSPDDDETPPPEETTAPPGGEETAPPEDEPTPQP